MSERLMQAMENVRKLPHITLGKIVEHVEGEALLILCLVAIMPFMQPIPIPGLSSVLGLIVLLQGVGLMLWGRPLLNKRLKEMTITHEKFEIIYKAAAKFSHMTSKISTFKHPLTNNRISQFLCGLSIVVSSGFLSLPLPIPLSNLIPALSIFLICVGLLEEDIVLLILGHGINFVVIWMAIFSYHIIADQFQSWFS